MAINKSDALFRKTVRNTVEALIERAKARLLGRFYQGPKIVFQIVRTFGLENSLEGAYRHTFMHDLGTGNEPEKEVIEAQADEVTSVMDAFKNRIISDVLNAAKSGSSDQIKEVLDKANVHMETIAATEIKRAQSMAADEAITKVAASVGIEDPTIFAVGVLDAKTCKHCLAMYHCASDPKIPRVYKKSQLSTAYFKPKMWDGKTVHLGAHPRCRHHITLLMPSFGFDLNGKVQYIGKGYDEFAAQKDRGDTE